MKLRPEEITSILRQRIEEFDVETNLAEVGAVLQLGDGIARVHGLENCVALEMLELDHGVVGLAFNLEEDNVGVALFGDVGQDQGGRPGAPHRRGRLGPGRRGAARPRRRPARQPARRPGADRRRPSAARSSSRRRASIERQPVKEPLQTGIKAIDSMTNVGRGQRELIIGDRSTGQDGDRGRHDPEPARPGREVHLRRRRPEGLDGRAGVRAAARGGRDGVHDDRDRAGARGRADQVDGAVRRRRDGRVLPLQGRARARHLRRPDQAGRRVPAALAAAPPPAGPRGVPGRRLLPALAAARARVQAERRARRRAR